MSAFKALTSSAVALVLLAGSGCRRYREEHQRQGGLHRDRLWIQVAGQEDRRRQVRQFECKDDCGVTGPWGFSWMAKGDDTMSTNGKSLISQTG